MKAFLSCFLCACMIAALVPISFAVGETAAITGETSRTQNEITLSDGTATGVQHTQINISGYYGNNRVINIAEADLSNTNLSMEVINCGTYLVSSQTMDKAAASYNAAHKGQTVLAAVNGDMWMTAVHSNSAVTQKVLKVPAGALIIDGEIWASQQIDQENIEATNEAKGTAVGAKMAFGITSLNQPVIGSPDIKLALDIGGTELMADGLNRLPAIDSIIVYNHRVNTTNYALNDSYEVVLTVDGAAEVYAGDSISATVTEIYESGSTTRPALGDKNTIVLTARGSRIEELRGACKIGEKITISTTLTDRYGNTELWLDVEDAIGGHMQVLYSDKGTPFYGNNTYYPTTLIGYKDNGNIAMVTVTSAYDKSRAALKISQAYELCCELGYNSVFYFDGGGSATFTTLEEGSYTVRNKCSDGSARAVINGIAFVWNDEPVCMRQGSLNHISVMPDISKISPTYIEGALLREIVRNPNAVDLSYKSSSDEFCLRVNQTTNDPYATLDYSYLSRVNADDYPYIVLRVRSTKAAEASFALYYSCGDDLGAGADRVVTFMTSGGNRQQSVIVDMSGKAGWSGLINNIRLDVFNETVYMGESMYISYIALCRTAEETAFVSRGGVPEGGFEGYAEYIEALKPTPDFVCGDIVADESINIGDLFKMKAILGGSSEPDLPEKYAADINGDDDISIADYYEMKYYLLMGKWRY